jgi:hypothetical protein
MVNPMRIITVLLVAVLAVCTANSLFAQNTLQGSAGISLQFSPSNPSVTNNQLEVRIVAELGSVKTDGDESPILTSFSMPVGFDPSFVRFVSATAGQAPGYSSAKFAFTQPAFANGRGLVTVLNSRVGSLNPGTQVELGKLVFEIKRPGNAWFVAGTARTTHQGALAAIPAISGPPVQRITWADHTYVVRIEAGSAGIPSLLCPSWFSVPSLFQGMALLNEGTESASIQMFGWGLDGTLVQSSSATNPSQSSSLPARNQDARLADDIFKSQGSMNVERGWIEVKANTPDVSGFFLQGVNKGDVTQQMDGVPMSYTPASRLVFPLVRDASRKTEISLANPGSSPVNISLRVSYPNGTPSGEQTFTARIPAHGTYSREITFAGNTSGAYVDVQAIDGKIVGVERISTEESFAALLGQDAELAATRLFGPQFASGYLGGDLRIDTHVALMNPSNASTVAVLRLLDDKGSEITSPVVYTLASGGLLSMEGWKLFGFPDPSTTMAVVSGSLVVESDQGLIGAVTFGDPVAGKYLAALPLMASAAAKREFHFGQVAVGLLGNVDYFTGLALANPSTTEEANISIELHDKDGTILAQTDVPYKLDPGGRTANLVQQLIPNFPASQFGGYMRLVSDIEVHAYMLIGDNYYNFLSAVP